MNWDKNPRIRLAASALHCGEIIAYPTEAVWGLGCNSLDQLAVTKLLALKSRQEAKGLILIAASATQLLPYIHGLSDEEIQRLSSVTQVPTTWIVPVSQWVPRWITGGRDTIAVRVTRHPLAAALCRVFGGPVVSTSANPQGKPPAKYAYKVRRYFRHRQVYLVPGPLGGANKPSEIRDLRSGEILRPGG